MWPDDYIDWATRAKPLILRGVRNVLKLTQLQDQAGSLANQAVRYAFDLAFARQRYRGYFPDYVGFRVWLASIAFREAYRLYLQHPLLEARLDLLADEQRAILGMFYFDRLPSGDIAGVLHCNADEVWQRRQAAFEALGRLP